MSVDITAASTPSTGPGTIHDVIREHVWNCSPHLQRYKGSARDPWSVWRVSRLRPVGTAVAVVQVPSINKGTYTHFYQSAMSLLVFEFTNLEGRNGELLVKELSNVDSHRNRVSSCTFKKPCGWEEVPMFNDRINEAIDHGCNWNDGDVLYSELETVLHHEASSAVAIYCFRPLKTLLVVSLNAQLLISCS